MKIKILAALLIIGKLACAQQPKGTYVGTPDQKLVFNKGGKIVYTLVYGRDIITPFEGTGTYLVQNDKLFISPVFENTPEFKKDSVISTSDTLHITVIAKPNEPAVGASVNVYKNGRMLYGTAVGMDGIARLSKQKIGKPDSVIIGYIGYRKAVFRPDDEYDHKVTLVEGVNNADNFRFATNNGKGFGIKLYKDSIQVRLPVDRNHSKTYEWVTFKK